MSPAPAPRSNAVTLGWTAFWSGLAQEMVYPLLPVFVVVSLHSSPTALGVIEGLLGVGVTVARFAGGRAVDRGASPLRIAQVSYAVSLAARPLMALAPGIAVVGALRVADGLGKGGKDAPKDTLVASDAVAGSMGRAFGIQTMLDTFGSVVGPLLAGLLLLVVGHGETGLRIVFGLACLPAIGALVQLRRVHDAPPRPRVERGERPRLPRAFYVLLAAVTLFGLANSSDTLLLLRARSTGLSPAGIAFLFAAFNLVYAALSVPAGALSDRIGRRRTLALAWAAYVVVYAGFAVVDGTAGLVAIYLGYGIYYAAADGTVKAWVTSLVPHERRAHAFGLVAAAGGLLMLPASVLAGVLWDRAGPDAAFLVGSATATCALLVLLLAPSLRGGAGGVTNP
ncbi:MAG: transporter [Thermoleophilia bacterium]|nr:transporter [Thermoleophilia bacterium]